MFVFILCFGFGAPMIANADPGGGSGKPALAEAHTLTYIYTQLSGAASLLAGSHDFTAMGVLDGRVIDYYDSSAMRKVPKQPWMTKELSAAYWEQGSLSRRSKQQWFKVNADILLNRMEHNQSDVHVLQWLHGCHGDLHPNGTVTFAGGVDTYSYDGRNFLSFDFEGGEWVAAAPAALETKRKWDDVPLLRDYTHAYLAKECITWMSRFLAYRRTHAQRTPPPSVDVFGRTTHTKDTLLLSCLASGFAGKDVILEIRRNGRTLTQEDGLKSSGVRPNQDDSFQRRDSVEVLARDEGKFTCVLRRPASGLHVETLWGGEILGAPAVDAGIVASVAAASGSAGLLVIALGWFLYRKYKGGAADEVAPADAVQEQSKNCKLLEIEEVTNQSLYSSASSGSVATSTNLLRDSPGSETPLSFGD